MKKRVLFTGILVISLLFAGIRFYIQSLDSASTPELRITCNGQEIYWMVGMNKWNGSVYDRMDILQYITMMDASEHESLQFSEGDTIEIEFLGKVPKTFTLTEELIDRSDNTILEHSRRSIPIELQQGKTSFILSARDDQPSADNRLRGCRLTCRWNQNECEYGFVFLVKK